jgi:hypothetical protein
VEHKAPNVPRSALIKMIRFFVNKLSSVACNHGRITQNGVGNPKSAMNKM